MRFFSRMQVSLVLFIHTTHLFSVTSYEALFDILCYFFIFCFLWPLFAWHLLVACFSILKGHVALICHTDADFGAQTNLLAHTTQFQALLR